MRLLSQNEETGYILEFPDFSVYYADGETADEALKKAKDARLKTAEEFKDFIPSLKRDFS